MLVTDIIIYTKIFTFYPIILINLSLNYLTNFNYQHFQRVVYKMVNIGEIVSSM